MSVNTPSRTQRHTAANVLSNSDALRLRRPHTFGSGQSRAKWPTR
jgi:hypothetical protein